MSQSAKTAHFQSGINPNDAEVSSGSMIFTFVLLAGIILLRKKFWIKNHLKLFCFGEEVAKEVKELLKQFFLLEKTTVERRVCSIM